MVTFALKVSCVKSTENQKNIAPQRLKLPLKGLITGEIYEWKHEGRSSREKTQASNQEGKNRKEEEKKTGESAETEKQVDASRSSSHC